MLESLTSFAWLLEYSSPLADACEHFTILAHVWEGFFTTQASDDGFIMLFGVPFMGGTVSSECIWCNMIWFSAVNQRISWCHLLGHRWMQQYRDCKLCVYSNLCGGIQSHLSRQVKWAVDCFLVPLMLCWMSDLAIWMCAVHQWLPDHWLVIVR